MNVGVLNTKIEPNGVHFKERKHKHTIYKTCCLMINLCLAIVYSSLDIVRIIQQCFWNCLELLKPL